MVEGNSFYFDWELKLIEVIQEHLSDFGINIMSLISAFGENLFTIAVLAIFYYWIDKDFGKKIGIICITGTVLNPMIKNIFFRKRPYFESEKIKCLKLIDSDASAYDLAAQGYSFPSGHSTTSGTTFWYLLKYFKKNWIRVILVILPILVGISRFSLGVHYPTDVICGFLLALVIIFIYEFLFKKIKDERIIYLIFLSIGFIGFFYAKSNDFYSGYGLLLGASIGFVFEKKYVNFSKPSKWYFGIIRVILAVILFFSLNIVLKMPFSESFLDSGVFLANIVRTIRYTINTFVLIGILPMSFKLEEKIAR